MKRFARIDCNVVAEILACDELPAFHPSLVWVEVTDAPAVDVGWRFVQDTFCAPVVDEPTANQVITHQILALEATVTDRRIREAVLGIDAGWLKALNDRISELRATLK